MEPKPLEFKLIQDRIDKFLRIKGGPKINKQLLDLRDLFKNKSSVTRNEAASVVSAKKSPREFQQWMSRVNGLFAETKIRLTLKSGSLKKGEKQPRVWFEGPMDAQEIIAAAERGREEPALYAPENFDAGINISYEFHALRFPGEVRGLLDQYREWEIDEESRSFLMGITMKAEPIVALDPEEDQVEIGFELLGIGPAGESFINCLKWLVEKNIPADAIRLSFLLVALLTARRILTIWTRYWTEAGDLLVTVNLDDEALTCPHIDDLLEKCLSQFKGNKPVFEVNEGLKADNIDRLLSLATAYKFELALDDSDSIKDRSARQQLRGHEKLRLVKHDNGATCALLKRSGREPRETIHELEQYMAKGKLYAIEGIENPRDREFLLGNWKKSKKGILLQGYAIKSTGPWSKFLRPIKEDPHRPGGYIILPDLPEKEKRERPPTEKADTCYPGEEPTCLGTEEYKILSQSHVDKRTRDYQKEQFEETVFSFDHGRRREPALPFLKRWALDPDQPFCVVLGEYGVGKTFLSRMLSSTLVDEHDHDPENVPAPLYCDLRDFPKWKPGEVPDTKTLVGQIIESRGIINITPDEGIGLIRKGKVLLIIDGFDEKACYMTQESARRLWTTIWGVLDLPKPEEEREIIKQTIGDFSVMAKKSRPRGKLLVTCRQHMFLDAADEKAQIAGEASHRLGFLPSDVLRADLEGFGDKEIEHVVMKRLDEKNGRALLDAIRKVHDLKDLAKRPVLLNYIIRESKTVLGLAKRGERVTDAVLYEAMVRNWLDRDSGKHRIEAEAKVLFMEELALLLSKKGQNEIHHSELYEWARPRIIAHHPGIKAVVQLLNDPDAAMDYIFSLETDFRTATFIIRDADGRFSFAHRSFHEYFLARSLVRLISKGAADALDLPLLSGPTVDFTLGIAKRPAYDSRAFGENVKTILESPYTPQRTENALRLYTMSIRLKDALSIPRPDTLHAEGARLAETDLSGLDIPNAHFDGAFAQRANFKGSKLSSASFTNAVLHDAIFDDALLFPCVSFASAKATGASFRRAKMTDIDLTGAELSGAQFLDADLKNVHFERAILKSAGLVNVDLREAEGKCYDAREARIVLGKSLNESRRIFEKHKVVFPPRKGEMNSYTLTKGIPTSINIEAGIALFTNNNCIHVVDLSDGRTLRILQGHTALINSAALSSNGKTALSGGYDDTVRVWDLSTGACLKVMESHQGSIYSVALSPDGKTAISGGFDNTVRVWDLSTGACLKVMEGHRNSVQSGALSSDGKTAVTGGDDNTVCAWDLSTFACLKVMEGHQDRVRSVALSSGGKTAVSGGKDKTIRVWDLSTGTCLKVMEGHKSTVQSVAISSDGKTAVSGGDDQTVRVWDLSTGECVNVLEVHRGSVEYVEISTDGKLAVSSGWDSTILIWDLSTGGRLKKVVEGFENSDYSIALSKDGKTAVSGGHDNTLCVWALATGDCLKVLEGHKSQSYSVALSLDEKMAISGGLDNTVYVWDLSTGLCLKAMEGHQDVIQSVAFSSDGKKAVSGGWDNTVRVWDLASGECIKTMEGHQDWVQSVAFLSDGKTIISGGDDHTIRIWNHTTGVCLKTMVANDHWIQSIAIALNGKMAVSGGRENTVRVWDLVTGECLKVLKGHRDRVSSVALSSDGKIVISGGNDGNIFFWDIPTGSSKRNFIGHHGSINSIALDGNEKKLISAGSDGMMKVWDVQTGECLVTFIPFKNGRFVRITGEGKIHGDDETLAQIFFEVPGRMASYSAEELVRIYPELRE